MAATRLASISPAPGQAFEESQVSEQESLERHRGLDRADRRMLSAFLLAAALRRRAMSTIATQGAALNITGRGGTSLHRLTGTPLLRARNTSDRAKPTLFQQRLMLNY